MSTIDKWEAEAKSYAEIKPIAFGVEFGVPEANKKILALIDLVKEAIAALKMVVMGYEYHDEKDCKVYGCKEALAVIDKWENWK